eukprot:Amastigsp_a342796_22.p2 type:complete len:125 gc:universal Amastigsp_a342796_22:236-610(+)
MRLTPWPGAETTQPRASSQPENWSVAPSTESMMEPTPPENAPSPSESSASAPKKTPRPCATAQEPTKNVSPINAPPATDAAVPTVDMPPFVPGGTVRQGAITSRGGERERTPSSDAHVSPQQAA